jgi:peptide deformylase
MAILPIVTYNDEVLREKAAEVKELTPEIKKLIRDMFETMYESEGVGLAAPQIGKSLRIFVMDADVITEDEAENEDLGPIAFINPVIKEFKGDKVRMEEGCLSIPDVRDSVSRHETVVVEYLDESFETQTIEASGWNSRVIQHEYDHLDGILFIDHLNAFRKGLHSVKLMQIEKGEMKTSYQLAPKMNRV